MKMVLSPIRMKTMPLPLHLVLENASETAMQRASICLPPSSAEVEKLYLVFFSSTGFNGMSQCAIGYQLCRICCMPYKASIVDIGELSFYLA